MCLEAPLAKEEVARYGGLTKSVPFSAMYRLAYALASKKK